MTQLRIAVIGCGAVTELGHLPGLRRVRDASAAVLVDRNRGRAEKLASAFGVPTVAEDYARLEDEVDAAIVALPHFLHAHVTMELLERGIHVLVEKPMALTAPECSAMVTAGERHRAVLTVGLMRRFRHLSRWVKDGIEAGILGRIESFDFREGDIFNWPLASDFLFHKEHAGGGVLTDTGAHTLDLLLWWLGDVASFEYYDDDYGGVEADCELHLTMASGARGVVELSRTRQLRNTAILRGERGQLEISLYDNRVTGTPDKLLDYAIDGMKPARLPQQSYEDLFALQLSAWVNAIRTGAALFVTGTDAARSIALIESCHRERRDLKLPWVQPEGVRAHESSPAADRS